MVFPQLDSKGKKRRRIIYLDGMAANILARRAEEWPRGPVFQGERGPWTKNGLIQAFHKVNEHAEIEGLCCYALRHSWITRMLEKGVDVATVAELAGSSPRLILETYAHVACNEQRLLDAL